MENRSILAAALGFYRLHFAAGLLACVAAFKKTNAAKIGHKSRHHRFGQRSETSDISVRTFDVRPTVEAVVQE